MNRLAALVVGILLGGMASCTGRVPAPCTACGDTCVDIKVDSSNCGECGRKCAPGSVCSAGACVASCPAPQASCGAGCFDLSVDPRHCGACGNACVAGCVDGGCAPVVTRCGALAECGGQCTDTSLDPSNCGGCGNICDAGICSAGTCVLGCGSGQRVCAGRCADTAVDLQNCGGCGQACDGGSCVAGACRSLCAAGFVPCNGTCVATDSDVSNCGGCGVSCPAGPRATPTCAAGRCGLSCTPGSRNCDGVVANGCESDLSCTVPISMLANGSMANSFASPRVDTAVFHTFDVSADGQRVAFSTAADGIVAADTNGRSDYFVRDLTTGLTTGLTHAFPGGSPATPELAMAANGELVVFTSPLDLTGQGSDGAVLIYAWHAPTGRFARIVDTNTHDERDLDLSDDGRHLVFISSATNLGAAPQQNRVYHHVLDGGFSVVFEPSPVILDSGCGFVGVAQARISGNGQVASVVTNARLTSNDSNGAFDTFRRPLDGGAIELVSLLADGGPVTGVSCTTAGGSGDVNGDGSLTAFHADVRLTGGTGTNFEAYAHRQTTFRLSQPGEASFFPSVDEAGLRFAFTANQGCAWADASGTMVTQTTLSNSCVRARIAASGRAAVFLTREALTMTDANDGGLDLYLRFLP